MPISQPNPRFSGYSSFGQGTPKTVSVQTSSTLLLGANPLRLYIQINNNGIKPIWLGQGQDARVGFGQRLMPNAMKNFVANELYLGEITAISESGVVNTDVIEGV